MKVFVGLLGSIWSIVGTGILLYVSLTTGLGPWLAPMLVLLTGIVLRFISSKAILHRQHDMVIAQTIGSVGGAVATAVGFSLPTLFFLDRALFMQWVASPWYFATLVGSLVLSAGWYGIWIARVIGQPLLENTAFSFPVSTVIVETICSQAQRAHARLLAWGVGVSWLVAVLRDGFWQVQALIARTFYVMPSVLGRELPLEVSPIYWAIGFLASMSIVWPLLVGMLSKYFIVWPLNAHGIYLPVQLFAPLRAADFVLAFCSGIVLSQAAKTLTRYPAMIQKGIRAYCGTQSVPEKIWSDLQTWWGLRPAQVSVDGECLIHSGWSIYTLFCQYELLIPIVLSIAMLSHLRFPVVAQVLLFVFTLLTTYQLSIFACRTGLAPYGRFMTFVMLPLLLLFSLSNVHITFLCVFVGVAGAAAVDLLFGYKVGALTNISRSRIHRAQILGLVVTALTIGWMLWLLCSRFELGSAPLIAHRGRARALLLTSFSFNWWVLALGILYDLFLQRFRINSMLVFGGLIMPNQITIGLTIGALIHRFSNKQNKQIPFWSGVFAGDSLWVLVQLSLTLL